MKITYMKDGKPLWPKWKDESDCTEEERKIANLRTIKEEEIVLDSDDRKLEDVIKDLDKKKLAYRAYSHRDDGTGHVHLVFPDLIKLTQGDRKLLRDIFIRKYGCDTAKSSELTIIAMEKKAHFKTGMNKELVKEVPGDNKLPEWLLDKFHKEKAKLSGNINLEELLRGVQEGKRNLSTVILASYYRKKGLNFEDTLEKVKEWNKNNKPPYPDNELVATVRGAFRPSSPYNYRFSGPDAGQGDHNKVSRLVEYAREGCELFHDQFNEGYAWINQREIKRVNGSGMKSYLSKLFWDRENDALDSTAISSVVNLFEALAQYEGQMVYLHNRVAWLGKSIYYDMGDEDWSVIEISENGWSIKKDHPPLFRRFKHQHPQVVPEKGEHTLDDFINLIALVDDDVKLLYNVWVALTFVPGINHTIMIPYGPQGSGKSMMQGLTRSLVDPSVLGVLSFPKDKNELIQLLDHHYVALFDNVTNITQEQSDILCKSSTGIGYSKRVLYSDDSDKIYQHKRILGLNGINNPAKRPDLLDRAVLFGLERITKKGRKKEEDLKKAFEEMKPSVLADILDTVSKAMRIYPQIDIKENLPRMADFAAWGEAVSRAMGNPELSFLNAYLRNIDTKNLEAVDMFLIGPAIMALMEDRNRWEGTATALLNMITIKADELKIDTKSRTWPKAPNALSRRLNEIRTNLEDLGLKYTERRTMKNVIKILKWDDDIWERKKAERDKEDTENSKNSGNNKNIRRYLNTSNL
jgi:hypothetical protein